MLDNADFIFSGGGRKFAEIFFGTSSGTCNVQDNLFGDGKNL